MTESAQPRVFLVDDHELIRSGIRAEIASSVNIVGEADEVEAAIEMILERTPDVVLLDVHMPDGGGQAVLRAVGEHETTTRFLALSVSDASVDVISVIRAGARGYVTKNISGPDLIDAIYRIAAGDVVFSPRLAGFVLDAFSTGQDDQPILAVDPRPRSVDRARTPGAATDRARLLLQGHRQGTDDLDQDGRESRLVGPSQTATVQPLPAVALGERTPPELAVPVAPSLLGRGQCQGTATVPRSMTGIAGRK